MTQPDQIKEQVRSLWRLCFHDSEEFMDMYFSLRYRDELNLCMMEHQEVVSSLQMIPYPMTFCGQLVDTSYISGACTHPEKREHGLMKKLLAQAFQQMFQQGVAFSTLIPAEPWLFNYYTRFGYATTFYYSESIFPICYQKLPEGYTLRRDSNYNQELYEYFQSCMTERDYCIQHTEEDFRVILADLTLTGGGSYWLTEGDRIVAMALLSKEAGEIQIKEILGDSPNKKELLLTAITERLTCNSFRLIQPVSKDSPALKLGMARIISAQQVLSVWAAHHPEKELFVYLQDEFLPQNEGYYHIYNGECVYSQKQERETFVSMNISELTEHLLAPLCPYMSLMLN